MGGTKQKAELKMDELEKIVAERTAAAWRTRRPHDKLTGLPNRTLLEDRLNQAIQRAQRNSNYHFALFFLDFDRFKIVNDSLGHEAGDELLLAIGKRLTRSMRATDSVGVMDVSTAARMGGDEFVVLADDLKNPDDAAAIAQRMLKILGEPYQLKSHTVNHTASIGITTSALGYKTAADMLRDADTAMYHAKATGKARYVMFDREMHKQVTTRLEMENDLRGVAERNELVLHYQPIVSLVDGSLEGFEAR